MDMTANSPSRRVAVATSPTGRYDLFKCTLIARQRVVLSDVQRKIRQVRCERPGKDDAVNVQRSKRA